MSDQEPNLQQVVNTYYMHSIWIFLLCMSMHGDASGLHCYGHEGCSPCSSAFMSHVCHVSLATTEALINYDKITKLLHNGIHAYACGFMVNAAWGTAGTSML